MTPLLLRVSLLGLLVVPSLLACSRNLSTTPTALKDFTQPDLYATGLGGTVSVSVGMGGEVAGLTETFCPQLLPEARATLDGQPLTLVERGSATNTTLGSYCNSPMFRLTGPWEPQQDAVSTFEVTDGTLTLRMKVRGLGVARTAHLVEPADKLLTAGEEVLIEWMPETDVLRASEVSVSLWSIATQGKDHATVSGDALRIEGNRIRFTMPAFAKGKLSLRVSAGHSGPILECQGTCSAPESQVTVEEEPEVL
jgi:hypothetical protein